MCVALIGVLYAIILAIILLKSPDIIPEQRRGNVFSAVGYTCLVVPLLVFGVGRPQLISLSTFNSSSKIMPEYLNNWSLLPQILLVNKEDGLRELLYIEVVLPLLISLFTLMLLSFGAKGGNHCKQSFTPHQKD